MDKNTLFKISLILLALAMLVCFYFLFQYAHSEGYKCLADPIGYGWNHTELRQGVGDMPNTVIIKNFQVPK